MIRRQIAQILLANGLTRGSWASSIPLSRGPPGEVHPPRGPAELAMFTNKTTKMLLFGVFAIMAATMLELVTAASML